MIRPDPKLELEPDQYWMAQVYGKVREESGLLFESVCDALVKLAVRGPDYPGLGTLHVEYRVVQLVEWLLGNADETRWLSLASMNDGIQDLTPVHTPSGGAIIDAVRADPKRNPESITALTASYAL